MPWSSCTTGEPARRSVKEAIGPGPGGRSARPRDERPVAGAHELLELGLGVAERARGRVGRLGAELVRLVVRDARQAETGALAERGVERLRLHVQVVRVLVVE